MKYTMTGSRWMAVLWMCIGLVFGSLGTQALRAQQGGIQRAILFRTDAAPASVPMEVVLGTAEIPAAGNAGRHSHPGVEVGYVLSGEAVMEVTGEAPRAVKPGEVYFIPAGMAHDAKVTSATSAKVLAFYLVEKGKPLAVSAP